MVLNGRLCQWAALDGEHVSGGSFPAAANFNLQPLTVSLPSTSRDQQGVMKPSKGQVMLPRKLEQVDQIPIPTPSRRYVP
jgi:hypothetical protein